MRNQRFVALMLIVTIIMFLQVERVQIVNASGGYGPIVVSATPEQYSTDVSPDEIISIEFDINITEGLHYDLISLVSSDNGQRVDSSVRIVDNRMYIQPEEALHTNETYLLYVPVDAVQSADETRLREAFILEFGTFVEATALEMVEQEAVQSLLAKGRQLKTFVEDFEQELLLDEGMTEFQIQPTSLTTAQIFAGSQHSGYLNANGIASSWGSNSSGQLGTGNYTDIGYPTATSNSAGSLIQVKAGGSRTFAINTQDEVWGWGLNFMGMLGLGPYWSNQPNPAHVIKEDFTYLNDILAIEAGSSHTLAVDSFGEVWSWGLNSYGELGTGDTNERYFATQVLGPGGIGELEDISDVSAGGNHSIALDYYGNVWGWGLNSRGQLGNGTLTNSSAPVQVKASASTSLSQVSAVSTGYDFTVALKSNGTVWAWGRNNEGQLGDGTATDRIYPVQVKGPGGNGYLTNIVAISSGSAHTLALRNDGTVWSWGNNQYGQLGNGLLMNSAVPVQVIAGASTGMLQQATQIVAGDYHSLALTTSGLMAWGNNNRGQLGNRSQENSPFPVAVQWTVVARITNAQYTYNNGRLVKIRYTIQGGSVYEQTFVYDANGNLTNTTTTVVS